MHTKEAGFISKILIIYAFLLFCIYPFYYENGYYNIGIAKNNFLSVILYIAFTAMIVAMGFYSRALKKRNRKFLERKRVSITEKFLYVYMLSIVVAFLFSPFKIDILQGADGWFLGTLPLLLMTGMSFFVIHMWKEQCWLRYSVMIVSAIIFGLGICNRFSCYPIAIEPANPSFISTLGNINWFCGYMSVISPIGISLFILQEEYEYKKKATKIMYTLYVWIAFVAGVCQGSDSVIIWNAALFISLYWISVKSIYCIRKWLLSIFLWGMAVQFVKMLIFLFPDNYNYDISIIVESNVSLFISMVALIFYFLVGYIAKEKKEFSEKVVRGIRIGIILLITISLISWLLLFIYNSTIGVDVLQGNELLTFDDNWGNGRGIILKTSFWIFSEMSFWQKIFGVGADGFYFFAYSIPEIESYLVNLYGESILTNAHCEIFTNIINLGIFGTIAYLGFLFTFIFRCMNKGSKNYLLYIPAVCVICYLANNLVSFAQILNIPYLFLIVGIGEFNLQNKKQ